MSPRGSDTTQDGQAPDLPRRRSKPARFFAQVLRRPVDERQQLIDRIRDAGQSDDEIKRAVSEGRLPTLAVESALGGIATHTLTDVARASRLQTDYLRDMMRAAGRANPRRGERKFSDEDIELAKLVRQLLDAGLPREELVEVERVIARGVAQAAEAVRRMVANALLEPGDSEERLGVRYAAAIDELAPLLPDLLAYQFRAHLRDGIRRELISEAEREIGKLSGTQDVAVAFGDLVGYTRLSEHVAAEEASRIAARLGELAFEAVEPPVQLVKMIGDAVMLVSRDAEPLVGAVTQLRDAVCAEGERYPSIKIGVSYGPATSRGGDWFGATVNLASRLTDAAAPTHVVASRAVQERVPGLSWREAGEHRLEGVSDPVELFVLPHEDGDRANGDGR